MADTGSLDRANAVMKIVGAGHKKQYEETPLLHNRLQKGEGTKISDRGLEIPTGMTPNPAHTWMTDGGDFPVGGSPGIDRAQVFFKNFAATCQLTGAAIDAIKGKDVSYVTNYLTHTLDETVSRGYKLMNIYGWGTGNSKLATISATATSATQTVNNNDANRFLMDGLVVDVMNTSTGVAEQSAKTISNSKASSTTFTFSASTTCTSGNIIVPAGGYNLAVTGIAQMVDDTTNGSTTFQGLSRNTYTQYRSFRVNANSAGLDVSHLRRLLGAGIHINKGKLDRNALELWSHPSQWSAYNALGWGLKRFEGSSKSVDLGYTAAEYEGISWVQDVDAPKDRIYGLDWSTMFKVTAKDFGWDDKTGAILRQTPSSTAGQYADKFQAMWTFRGNYGCYRPNASGFVDSLAVPTGF